MNVVVSGRNVTITDDLRDYVEGKVGRLERYMPNIGEVRVDLADTKGSEGGERHVAQLTVRHERGRILRAEERSDDVLSAVDAAIDKLSRQIERHKGRGKWRRSKGREAKQRRQMDALMAEEAPEAFDGGTAEELQEYAIVRRKRFVVTPMDEMEAIEQLELLDHDFFLFYNANTATINVAYRRKGGGYGILEPELG